MLKGPWLERYEFGAALRAINGPGQPALGLLIWQNKEEKLCIWLKQHQARWILEVDGKLSGTDTAHLEFELSASFDASIWHALRLVRSSDGLTGFLDGHEVFTLSVPAASERVGLATRNAAAAFTSVWLTGFPHE